MGLRVVSCRKEQDEPAYRLLSWDNDWKPSRVSGKVPGMAENQTLAHIEDRIREAVSMYWRTRAAQRDRQQKSGASDQGLRSAVTGGAQMDGFVEFFADLIADAGMPRESIARKKAVELPGFFRPTKEWDLVVVHDQVLVAAIEAKSQVGPSFGNNFNNRTEEALGSAVDLWTAFREGAFLASPQPFLGYFFMLEECPASSRVVKVQEPHFKVFPEFVGASYLKRYELFCRKLVLERHYTSAAFITSTQPQGENGTYAVPAEDLSVVRFVRALVAHIASLA